MKITFKPVKISDCSLLHEWLQLNHVRQFWDDGDRKLSQVVENYTKQDGTERYIFYIDNIPAGYIQSYHADVSSQFMKQAKLTQAIGLDMFIGNISYLHKGYASIVLGIFISNHCGFSKSIIVDPAINNFKAIHVYKKIGFVKCTEFYENGNLHQLMVKYLF